MTGDGNELEQESNQPSEIEALKPADAAVKNPSADDIAKAEAARTSKSSGSLAEYVDKPTARSMEILAVDKDGNPITISRESKVTGKDLAPEAANKASLKAGEGLEIHKGVSPFFKERVEAFWNSVPEEVRRKAVAAGIRVVVVNEATQIVPDAKTSKARRHAEGETLAQQPGFYFPKLKAVVLVEHPEATEAELKAKAIMEARGVNVPGHFKERSFEETAWHEFGHGLDFAALAHITKSKAFDEMYQEGLKRVKEEDRQRWAYYVRPDRADYTAAREELFAQIFWLRQKGPTRRTDGENRMLNAFKEIVDWMNKKL